jgi:hypothetical protein
MLSSEMNVLIQRVESVLECRGTILSVCLATRDEYRI